MARALLAFRPSAAGVDHEHRKPPEQHRQGKKYRHGGTGDGPSQQRQPKGTSH